MQYNAFCMSPDIIKNEYPSAVFLLRLKERSVSHEWNGARINFARCYTTVARKWNASETTRRQFVVALSLCISIKARLHFFITTCIKRNECFIVYRYHCAVGTVEKEETRETIYLEKYVVLFKVLLSNFLSPCLSRYKLGKFGCD